MEDEAIIEKAQELLRPIEFDPPCVGYYIRKNGDDMGETFCADCIKEQVKSARKHHKLERQRILIDFATLERTGKWRGKRLKKALSSDEIKKAKRFHLKEYPSKVVFEVEGCDPDFGGGETEPRCCDSCGDYFHTNFCPDLECATYLLEDFDAGKELLPHLKWKLDIAFYNYCHTEKEVQEILMQIAKRIIASNNSLTPLVASHTTG